MSLFTLQCLIKYFSFNHKSVTSVMTQECLLHNRLIRVISLYAHITGCESQRGDATREQEHNHSSLHVCVQDVGLPTAKEKK